MTLLHVIRECLQNYDKTKLIKKLDYNTAKNGFIMLDKLLTSTTLHEWLRSSNYDFVYYSESFLKAVCDELKIDKDLYQYEINQAKKYNSEIDRLNKIYIFVNTDFKRVIKHIDLNNVTVSMNFTRESLRRLLLPNINELIGKTFDEIVQFMSNVIKQHYIVNRGSLGVCGKIKNYNLHIDDKIYLFDTNGEFLDEIDYMELDNGSNSFLVW